MKKLFAFTGPLALTLAASSALAQTAPAATQATTGPTGKPVKMGVVDMQRISQESLLGKSYATKMDQLESEIRSELTKRQNQIAQIDAALVGAEGDADQV